MELGFEDDSYNAETFSVILNDEELGTTFKTVHFLCDLSMGPIG
jgi:hypothetical protein